MTQQSFAKPNKRLTAIQLAAVIFLTVSGGPYGLEPLLTYASGHTALLLLLITPVLWDIPAILTVLELNSMMPVEGGYYQWVKRALGLRFGFYEGWCTWLYTFVDLAIYPVLFVQYAAYFFPQIDAYKIPVCLLIIWSGAILNIIGIVPVGKVATVLGIIVIIPFIILFIFSFAAHSFSFSSIEFPAKSMNVSTLGLALYTIMWNFIGWDNATTYAEEVNKPIKTYFTSTITAFIFIIVIYTLAIIAAQQSGIATDKLNEEGFPAVGELLGGRWLGSVLSAGGMASALGLFSSVLLSVSRVPKVMAEDKLLPAIVDVEHPSYKTPYVSIIICAVVVSAMILWSFEELIVIDVTVYGAGLFLEYVALIAFRIKSPDQHRPFRIPLNIAGLCLMALIPFIVYSIALIGAFSEEANSVKPALFAMLALVCGEIVWQIIRWRQKRKLH